MKIKDRPESKIPTTQTNTNKKREPDVPDGEKKLDTSLLKKNEFALILLGALLLTMIVFFFFFRSSGSKTEPVHTGIPNAAVTDLEKRIQNMESQLQEKSLQPETDKTVNDGLAIDAVTERVARLETAFSVKFDSLAERMAAIEKNISMMNTRPVTTPAASKPEPKPEPKPAPPVKRAAKKEKTGAMFHTVQKGETLYSISKKYKTSVESLRKLNNLSSNTNIYPGNNILIR